MTFLGLSFSKPHWLLTFYALKSLGCLAERGLEAAVNRVECHVPRKPEPERTITR